MVRSAAILYWGEARMRIVVRHLEREKEVLGGHVDDDERGHAPRLGLPLIVDEDGVLRQDVVDIQVARLVEHLVGGHHLDLPLQRDVLVDLVERHFSKSSVTCSAADCCQEKVASNGATNPES
eukprot:3391015-Pleurochrysis_carterae.AAC.1